MKDPIYEKKLKVKFSFLLPFLYFFIFSFIDLSDNGKFFDWFGNFGAYIGAIFIFPLILLFLIGFSVDYEK